MFTPSLPAATTTSTPLLCASSIASWSADDFDELPNEQLMILRPRLIAYSMPSAASDVEPRPLESMNLIGTIEPFQHVPDTPVSLLALAAMIPETWVPWPLSSSPSPLPATRSIPMLSSTQPFLSSSLLLFGLSAELT